MVWLSEGSSVSVDEFSELPESSSLSSAGAGHGVGTAPEIPLLHFLPVFLLEKQEELILPRTHGHRLRCRTWHYRLFLPFRSVLQVLSRGYQWKKVTKLLLPDIRP